MPIAKPTPSTWTLRLKHHKTTVLLHVDPLQTLSSIKTELVHVLRETYPNGTLNGQQLPSKPDDIDLAKLADVTDMEKGWVRIDAQAKGKDSLKAEGVKDNAMLAFRWVEAENGETDVDKLLKWPVVLPKYEDSYMDGLEEDEGIA